MYPCVCVAREKVSEVISEYMPERTLEMGQLECQKECQNIWHAECQIECPNRKYARQNAQKECHNYAGKNVRIHANMHKFMFVCLSACLDAMLPFMDLHKLAWPSCVETLARPNLHEVE